MIKIDNRGLNCPEPVIRTKKALSENPEGVISIVDHESARENVIRMARKEGYNARWEEKEGAYHIYITIGEPSPALAEEPEPVLSATGAGVLQKQVILIGTDQLGRGSEELGRLLMRNFIYTLSSCKDRPRAIVFINSGVKLCAEGSPVLEELQTLQKQGTAILVCGTCLDYYELKERLSVGRVSNMYEIADLLTTAARVLSL